MCHRAVYSGDNQYRRTNITADQAAWTKAVRDKYVEFRLKKKKTQDPVHYQRASHASKAVAINDKDSTSGKRTWWIRISHGKLCGRIPGVLWKQGKSVNPAQIAICHQKQKLHPIPFLSFDTCSPFGGWCSTHHYDVNDHVKWPGSNTNIHLEGISFQVTPVFYAE